MKQLISVFKLDKIPYLLTVLFLLLGWSVSHIADRLLSAPIVEYSYKESIHGDIDNVEYTINNISYDKLYKKIIFSILPSAGTNINIDTVEVKPVPPMVLENEPQFTNDCINIEIPEFHPGTSIKILFELPKGSKHNLHFSSDNTAIKLVKSCLMTLVVKHELTILLAMVALWLILIITYFAFIAININNE